MVVGDYLRFLGHAAFEVMLGGARLLIDPFLTGNPLAAASPRDFDQLDGVLVTHDHGDHLGDAVDICRRTGAPAVAIYDLAVHLQGQGVKEVVGLNIGGTAEVAGVRVTLVEALHSSERGHPTGFILRRGEHSIYHAGDTQVFSDMQLYRRLYHPTVALLPISGYYTMGPEEAALAVELLQPRIAVPMHYDTFPVIRQDPNRFAKLVKEAAPDVQVAILKPGDSLNL